VHGGGRQRDTRRAIGEALGMGAEGVVEGGLAYGADLLDAAVEDVRGREERETADKVDDYIACRRGEGASESLISKELVTLRAALRIAKRRGIWQDDVQAIIPVAFAPEYVPKTRYLTTSEMQRLLPELTKDRAARVAFIVATSARWSESERARRSHVADDCSNVEIAGTKTKTGKRNVPIVHPAARDLLRYAVANGGGKGDRLFTSWTNVRRDLHAACSRAKITPCSPNDLRRTFAHWLRHEGVPNDLIAPAMGHADTRMVERVYGKLSPSELALALAASMGRARAAHVAAQLPRGLLDALANFTDAEVAALVAAFTRQQAAPECSTSVAEPADSAGPTGLPGLLSFVGQALSAQKESHPEGGLVPRGGIEPPTRGFSVPCSTD
jgi:integrase